MLLTDVLGEVLKSGGCNEKKDPNNRKKCTETDHETAAQRGQAYEKCLTQGARFLTDEELLAVIIRTGSKDTTSLELARSILALEGHGTRLLGLLHHSLKDYCRIKGIGMVKGAQLMCIGELSRRIWNYKTKETVLSFTQPEQIARILYGKICGI